MRREPAMREFWRKRSVLVTGATGLLGGWLVKELISRGADVVALVRAENPRGMLSAEGMLEKISVVRGSLLDFAEIKRAMCEYSVDSVFHLAAQPLVGLAKLDPVNTLDANIRGTWNVLEAARQAQVGQVLVASSEKAYGHSDHLPYTEDQPLQGRFPYDVSKSCADLISKMYATTYELPVAISRCANLFGGGDLNSSRLIPSLIRSTLQGEQFVIRSDGHFVRDYIYVKDAVRAMLCLMQALSQDRTLSGEAFNFSMQVRLSVLDVVRHVLEAMHRTDLAPIIQNQASLEIREQFLSAEKARSVLGWHCRYNFANAIQETIEWYRGFFESEEPAFQLAKAAG